MKAAQRRLRDVTLTRVTRPPVLYSQARSFTAPSVIPPLRHPPFSPISRPALQTSNVFSSTLKSIGNTPLIKLKRASELTGCTIYGKAEYCNPGGSVKDRAALYIVKDAEERGLLEPGHGLIVEGTAGNTGIGLALVGNARGYQTVICIADTQSKEKKDTLRWSGASLLEVPAVPFANPNNYVHVASRLAALLSSRPSSPPVLYANQWDNLANRRAHIESTGPEIWEQTNHRIDAFSCATGTGGTLSGVGEYMRQQKRPVGIFLTDPRGAGLYRLFKEGKLRSEGDSISEGIGQGRVTGNMAGFTPDDAFEVKDAEALEAVFELMELEGLHVGLSSAINIAGAMQVARKLGKGKTIVTILCDRADRYAGKMYNPQFLKSRGLPVPRWLEDTQARVADLKGPLQEAMLPPPAPVSS